MEWWQAYGEECCLCGLAVCCGGMLRRKSVSQGEEKARRWYVLMLLMLLMYIDASPSYTFFRLTCICRLRLSHVSPPFYPYPCRTDIFALATMGFYCLEWVPWVIQWVQWPTCDVCW